MSRCALMSESQSVCRLRSVVCRGSKAAAYLTGDGFKFETRQFNYISQFKYWT